MFIELLQIIGVPKSSQINLDGQNPCKMPAEEFIFSKVAGLLKYKL